MFESGQTLPLSPTPPLGIPRTLAPPGAGSSTWEPPRSQTQPQASTEARSYRVLDYPERYAEVLALRHLAYGDSHQASTSGVDPRDHDASLIAAFEGSTLIATLRLTHPRPGPLFHPSAHFDGPVHTLPARPRCLESSRACIHPEHRGQGIFWHLAAEMLLTAQAAGKPFLLGGVDRHLLGFWTRCGYRATEVTYGYPGDPKDRYRVVVLEVAKVLDDSKIPGGRAIAPALAQALATRRAAQAGSSV